MADQVIRELGIKLVLEGNAGAESDKLNKKMSLLREKVGGSAQAFGRFREAAVRGLSLSPVVARLDGAIAKLKSNTLSLGDALSGVAGARGMQKLLGVGKEMVGLAAANEQTKVSFEVMLGSAEKAGQVMKDVAKFASVTPFTPEEVTGASRSLLAMGMEAESLIDTLKTVGDVASMASMPIADLAYIYGKNAADGIVQMEDLNQISGRGIPIMKELSRQFFGNDKQVRQVRELASKGQISFDNLASAFRSMTSKGGAAFNMMEKQSTTALGLWSTFQGNIDAIKMSVGQTIMGALKPLLSALVKLSSFVQQNEAAMTVLKGVLAAAAVVIGAGMVSAVSALASSLWASSVAATLGLFKAMLTLIPTLWGGAAAAWAFMAPLLPLIAIIGLLVAVIYDLWKGFNGGDSVIMNLFGKIKEFFGWLFGAIANIARKWQEVTNKLYAKAKGFFSGIWGRIKGFFSGIISSIKDFGSRAIDFITSPFKKAYEKISEFFQGIKDFFTGGDKIDIEIQGKHVAGKRAAGGPVLSGLPYLVGERGPEIFTPSSSGRIIPNNRLASSQTHAQISISPVFNISGAGNPQAVAQAVMRKMEELIPSVRQQLGLGQL